MIEIEVLRRIAQLKKRIDAVPVQGKIKINKKTANMQDRLLYVLYAELEDWEYEIDPINVFRELIR